MMWINDLFMHFVNSVRCNCTILMNFSKFNGIWTGLLLENKTFDRNGGQKPCH